MRRVLALGILIAFAYLMFPAPEAKAMDPVTISLLAPIAISVAKAASPYIIRGLVNAGKGMLRVGKDMLDFFRLPLGMFQATFLAPWYFRYGCRNIFLGSVAPFKMTYHMLLVPVLLTGLHINTN